MNDNMNKTKMCFYSKNLKEMNRNKETKGRKRAFFGFNKHSRKQKKIYRGRFLINRTYKIPLASVWHVQQRERNYKINSRIDISMKIFLLFLFFQTVCTKLLSS